MRRNISYLFAIFVSQFFFIKQLYCLAIRVSTANKHAEAVLTADGPLFNPADCNYPGGTGFEAVVSVQQLHFLFAEQDRHFIYAGRNSLHIDVAAQIHRDISCAIQQNSGFNKFCNSVLSTKEFNLNEFEAIAFLSQVKQETMGMTIFEELSNDRGCTHNNDYPCAQTNVSYHGRGPLLIKGNKDYGMLSEFLFKDKNKLLDNPSLIEPSGVSGWVAALWKWLTPRRYGDNCPTTYVKTGEMSCHDAIINYNKQDSSDNSTLWLGYGLCINILRGDTICCPQPLELPSELKSVISYHSENPLLGGFKYFPAKAMLHSGPLLRNETMIETPAKKDKIHKDERWPTLVKDIDKEIEKGMLGFYDANSFQFHEKHKALDVSFSNLQLTLSASATSPNGSNKEIEMSKRILNSADAAFRVGNLATFIRRMNLLKNDQEINLPGSVNCTNAETDADKLCESITRGCPSLSPTSMNGLTCVFVCLPIPTTVSAPGELSTVKFDACGYKCREEVKKLVP